MQLLICCKGQVSCIYAVLPAEAGVDKTRHLQKQSNFDGIRKAVFLPENHKQVTYLCLLQENATTILSYHFQQIPERNQNSQLLLTECLPGATQPCVQKLVTYNHCMVTQYNNYYISFNCELLPASQALIFKVTDLDAYSMSVNQKAACPVWLSFT